MNGVFPDDITLLNFFESEPVECDTRDGYWRYIVRNGEKELHVSLASAECSFQTVLKISGELVSVVCQEGLVKLDVYETVHGLKKLKGQFNYEDVAFSVVEITVKPDIFVNWYTLRK